VTGFPGPEERLLDHVLGFLERAEHPVAVDMELPPVTLRQRHERRLVASADGSQHGPLFFRDRH
jgi:hypothetical protein